MSKSENKYEKQIELAAELAFKAHAGKKRKYSGEDYYHHPRRVAERLQAKNLKDKPVVVAAGFLHDVLEDTELTEKDLLDAGILPEVVDVVKLVTRVTNVNYYLHIRHLSEDFSLAGRRAVQLKVADLEDNMSNLQEGSLLDKYRFAHHMLCQSLEAKKRA